MGTYFSAFPQITYANLTCLDLSARVALFQQPRQEKFFYPMTLQDQMRADQAAGTLYSDPTFDWMIYLTNNIVDPYYGWHLRQDDYLNYINQQYGSYANAAQYILYWRTAWPIDNSKTFPAAYINTVPATWKKYYKPNYGADHKIISYSEQFLDWRMNTNAIEQWDIEMESGNTAYNAGDLLNFTTSGGSVGTTQIISANTTQMLVQNTLQYTTQPITVSDFTSNTLPNATVLDTKVLQQNIGLDELVFWEPVTALMLENENNAYKRFIDVLEPANASKAYTSIVKALQGIK